MRQGFKHKEKCSHKNNILISMLSSKPILPFLFNKIRRKLEDSRTSTNLILVILQCNRRGGFKTHTIVVSKQFKTN